MILDFAGVAERTVDWASLETVLVPGATGSAHMRCCPAAGVQIRVVDYGPGYLADHWCAKGHILYVVTGELAIEHEDGAPTHLLTAGMTWCLADKQPPAHRVRSERGATVFIIDSLHSATG